MNDCPIAVPCKSTRFRSGITSRLNRRLIEFYKIQNYENKIGARYSKKVTQYDLNNYLQSIFIYEDFQDIY